MGETATKKGVTITNEVVEHLIKVVQDLYLADDIQWVIGYSGGKDSTAALQLVWMAIARLKPEQRTKAVHIINTNTLVESPIVAAWTEKSLQKMETMIEKQNLNMFVHRLKPDYYDTFWVNFLGKGYPFPRKKFRWCTTRLKIKPVNKFITDKIAEHGEIILVLGTRKAESASRKRHMEYYESKRVRELLSPNPTLINELVFSPLEDWTTEDIWMFLMQYDNPWGYDNEKLFSLYRSASLQNSDEEDDCPTMYDEGIELPSCGQSRFGCWVCTMVSQDKSMAAMITNDIEKEWLTPLLEFRDEFGDLKADRDRREYRRRRGNVQGSYKRLYHGPYKKDWREYFLRRLLEIQIEMRENAPEEFSDIELITHEELQAIRRLWVRENHEFDDSLPRIYKEVTGKEFYDPKWIGLEHFGKLEWDILSEVCNDLYPEEELLQEMVSNMIYLENEAQEKNDRKKLIEKLEKQMAKTFYRDEEDATEYYMNKIVRKKEKGADYDEKFLQDYGNQSTDEDAEEVEE